MLAEFFLICSHLLFFCTWAVAVGHLSPLFYAFVEREKAFNIIESITGGRMHPQLVSYRLCCSGFTQWLGSARWCIC